MALADSLRTLHHSFPASAIVLLCAVAGLVVCFGAIYASALRSLWAGLWAFLLPALGYGGWQLGAMLIRAGWPLGAVKPPISMDMLGYVSALPYLVLAGCMMLWLMTAVGWWPIWLLLAEGMGVLTIAAYLAHAFARWISETSLGELPLPYWALVTLWMCGSMLLYLSWPRPVARAGYCVGAAVVSLFFLCVPMVTALGLKLTLGGQWLGTIVLSGILWAMQSARSRATALAPDSSLPLSGVASARRPHPT